MQALSSGSEALAALNQARNVLYAGYAPPSGRVLRGLLAAAERGAHVCVRIEGRPFSDPSGARAAMAQRAVARLGAAGADAALADTAGLGPALHLKALLCDGVAYLDDCNFPRNNDTVLRDDCPRDASAIRSAALGKAPASDAVVATKAQALAQESAMLRAGSHARRVEVETESFGVSGTVYAALKELAARGVACRLLVCARALSPGARRAVRLLEAAGVQVRAGRFTEKLAATGTTEGWIGSANATSTYCNGDEIDWSVRTRARPIVRALENRFEAHWQRSTPI